MANRALISSLNTYLLKHLKTMLVIKDIIEKKTIVVIRFITFTFNVFNSGVIYFRTDTLIGLCQILFVSVCIFFFLLEVGP